LIELVYHPLGIEDVEQRKVAHDGRGLRWTQIPGFVAAEYREEGSSAPA
jgi:hypothetical protein